MPEFQTNFPIGQDSVIERGLDYLAVGDTHGFRYVPPNRKVPPTIYPGAPEPTAIDEVDPGHVDIVSFSRRREARVNPERVAAWTWEECTVHTLPELKTLRERRDLAKRVLRLHIDMRLAPDEHDEAEAILRELAGSPATHGRVGILVLERGGLKRDLADMATLVAGLPPVLASAAKRIKENTSVTEEVRQRALHNLLELARGG